MDMELNADQNALVDAVSHIVERHLALPKDGNVAAVVHSHYSDALDRDITEGGYLGIAREEGFGPLGAALLVEQVYRAPSVMEVAASAIVVPQLLDEDLPRPVAMMRKQDLSLPVRFLAVARTVLVDMGDDVAIVEVKEGKLMLTRGGDFILIGGKFPRLVSASGTSQLSEALKMIRSL